VHLCVSYCTPGHNKHMTLTSSTRATCPAHITRWHVTTLLMFHNRHKSQASSLWTLDQPPVTSFCTQNLPQHPAIQNSFNLCQSLHRRYQFIIQTKKYTLLLLLNAIEFSHGDSNPYISTNQTIRINIHKRNNTKTQYKQYKTQ